MSVSILEIIPEGLREQLIQEVKDLEKKEADPAKKTKEQIKNEIDSWAKSKTEKNK